MAHHAQEKVLRHRRFTWITTTFGLSNAEIAPDMVGQKLGVPESYLMRHCKEELQKEATIIALPFQLLLIVFYGLMTQIHEVPDAIRGIEMAFEHDITENGNFAFSSPGHIGHKDYRDVNTIPDFWSWMNVGYMPLVIQNTYPMSEAAIGAPALPMPDKSTYDYDRFLFHNLRIGGIRMVKETRSPKECLNRDMAEKFGIVCYDGQEKLNAALKPTEYHYSQTQIKSRDQTTGETVWIANYSLAGGPQYLYNLETSDWIDYRTSRVMVSFVIYNENHDVLVMTSVHFFFTQTGKIWKDITHRTIQLRPYASWGVYICDALFYGHITIIFVGELYEVLMGLKDENWHVSKFFQSYFNLWNVVDWISIITAYALLVLWIMRVNWSSQLGEDVKDLSAQLAACEGGAGPYPAHECNFLLTKFFSDIDDVGYAIREFGTLVSIFPLIMMARLFKAFAAQPKLGVVTKTMKNASVDIYHFGIVLSTIFFTFSLMGCAYFGSEYDRFATIERSCMGLFRFLMGDFSIEDMQVSGRGFTTFYFMAFEMCVLMIMMNMLIAMILDVYTMAKNEAKTSSSFFQDTYDQLRRTLQNVQKDRVPLDYIVKAYDKATHDRRQANDMVDRVIRPQDFQKTVDENIVTVASKFESMRMEGTGNIMRDRQAKRLICNAATQWYNTHPNSIDLITIGEQLAAISNQVEVIEEEIHGADLTDMADEDGPDAGPDAEALAEGVKIKAMLEASLISLDLKEGQVMNGADEAVRLGLQSLIHMVSDLEFESHQKV